MSLLLLVILPVISVLFLMVGLNYIYDLLKNKRFPDTYFTINWFSYYLFFIDIFLAVVKRLLPEKGYQIIFKTCIIMLAIITISISVVSMLLWIRLLDREIF